MKILNLFAAAVLSAAALAVCVFAPTRVCFADAESYTFFCGTSSADCREVRAGAGYSLVKATLTNVCGERAEYPAEGFDLESFLALYDAEIIFCEELEDSVNYYCAARLPYSVTLYGREINLHVCVKESGVLAASPIIFGGY